MKKTCALTMAGVAIFLLAGTQSFAGSGTLNFADDRAEGVSFSEEVAPTANQYVYDSRNAGAEESLTETVFFSNESNSDEMIHYLGDMTTPSMQNMMAEGICLETFKSVNIPN